MIDGWDAIRIAFRELTSGAERPYVGNVLERAAQVLVRENQGSVTQQEAYSRVKQAAGELEKAGLLESSIRPADTWKLSGSILGYDIRHISNPKLSAKFKERQRLFSQEIGDINTKAIKAGAFRGSAHLQTIRKACDHEARERARTAWDELRTIVTELGVPRSNELADGLKTELRRHLINSSADLVQAIKGVRDSVSGAVGVDPEEQVTGSLNKALNEIGADTDLFNGAFSDRKAARRRAISAEVRPELIFLSHASADAKIGQLLKKELEHRIRGTEVFCASHPGDIPVGFSWSPKIQEALKEAGSLVLVATPRSISRPWVWFECGTFWFDRPKFILCLGGVRKQELPPPLNELQAINLGDASEVKAMLNSLVEVAGVRLTDKDKLDDLVKCLAKTEWIAAGSVTTDQDQ